MTINKKFATILFGIGMSVSAANVSAVAPTECYDFRDWCVAKVKQFYPNNWWNTADYRNCLDAYDECIATDAYTDDYL